MCLNHEKLFLTSPRKTNFTTNQTAFWLSVLLSFHTLCLQNFHSYACPTLERPSSPIHTVQFHAHSIWSVAFMTRRENRHIFLKNERNKLKMVERILLDIECQVVGIFTWSCWIHTIYMVFPFLLTKFGAYTNPKFPPTWICNCHGYGYVWRSWAYLRVFNSLRSNKWYFVTFVVDSIYLGIAPNEPTIDAWFGLLEGNPVTDNI